MAFRCWKKIDANGNINRLFPRFIGRRREGERGGRKSLELVGNESGGGRVWSWLGMRVGKEEYGGGWE